MAIEFDWGHLSGSWTGISTNLQTNDVTEWTNFELLFEMLEGDTNLGKINGKGCSIFQNSKTRFILFGFFNVKKQTCQLLKKHYGLHNNDIVYNGSFVAPYTELKLKATYSQACLSQAH